MIERYVRVDGRKVRYVSEGSGIDLILIHGLGGSAESWLPNIHQLSKRFRVYSPDLPGFGYSEKMATGYRIEDFVDFLKRFLNILRIDTFSLVGSSMGGQIAATFTARYGDLVSRLVLEDSAGISLEYTPSLRTYLDLSLSKESVSRRLAALVLDRSVITERMVERTLHFLSLPGSMEAFMRATEGSASAPRLKGLLHKIKVPTLIIWGREDPLIPVNHAYEFSAGISGSRLHILDHCGHLPHLENPEEFNRLVIRFLTSQ